MAALLGRDASRRPAHAVAHSGPLARRAVFAALAVIVTSPIVILARNDVRVAASDVGAMTGSARRRRPHFVTWAMYVALTLVVGIFWFDWLFGVPGLDFEQAIVTALVAGASC